MDNNLTRFAVGWWDHEVYIRIWKFQKLILFRN